MARTKIFDAVIVGSGATGEKAAAQAAYFDKRVIIFEKASAPGGAAVQTGTLPSSSDATEKPTR